MAPLRFAPLYLHICCRHDRRLRHAEAGGSVRGRGHAAAADKRRRAAIAEAATTDLATPNSSTHGGAKFHARMAALATKAGLAQVKAEILGSIIGAAGFQIIIIVGAVAGLIRLPEPECWPRDGSNSDPLRRFTLQLSHGIAGVTSDVGMTVLTAGGRTITRDTEILVSAAVG